MFCSKCGKEVNDDAVVCIHCGCELKENKNKKDYETEKTGIGVLCGLFLGIIGLIIGFCMYPADTVARKTFLKGWGIAFGIAVVLIVIIYIAVFATVCSSLEPYYGYGY